MGRAGNTNGYSYQGNGIKEYSPDNGISGCEYSGIREFDSGKGSLETDIEEGITSRVTATGNAVSEVNKLPAVKSQKKAIIFAIDLAILICSFLLTALYKPATANYLSAEYLAAFGFLLITWSASSFYFKKYNFRKKHNTERFVRTVLLSNFVTLGTILVVIILLWYSGFSRIMLFGTIGLATFLELFAGNIYYSLLKTKTINGYDLFNPPANTLELEKAMAARNFPESTLESNIIKNAVTEECGEGIYSFMQRFIDGDCNRTLFISTSSRVNIEMHSSTAFMALVNMKRVNDINFINKFFETVNRKLPEGGAFIGCAETKDLRKKRILKKYPPVLNWIFYALDYLLKRVFPKFILTKKIYYLFTRGQNRVISRAELLGRLYSCGFELIDDEFVNGLYCFAVKKVKSPVYDLDPTYGPFVKLHRVGKDGRIIRVYKFRTMHPYSEYLQDYLFKNNSLDKGGKYKNDFRITTLGRMMRSVWLDELPMLFNLIKGDVKLVGVRPLSMNYFSLYDKTLQRRRIKYKPGLIPPFYADMPDTLNEIQASELRYLQNYDRRPVLTDLDYFRRAFFNIAFKMARSK
jgi:hypothetical protein